MKKYLDKVSKDYYDGKPTLTDAEFDFLAEKYNYSCIGAKSPDNRVKHYARMYSLQKVYDDDKPPFVSAGIVESIKLDGAAISLLYVDGNLVQAATRGDGIHGVDITDKILASKFIPSYIFSAQTIDTVVQITGEIVTLATTNNSRNYAAGALNLKDINEFLKRDLWFVAYGSTIEADSYIEQMQILEDWDMAFTSVLNVKRDKFPSDGTVYRLDATEVFNSFGYTSKHPKGAYALKKRSDIAIEEAKLLEVKWQLGKGGKVTPVAIFTEVVIDDAKITRATLHNAGFVEDLKLHIGDTLLITRAGSVIPKVVGKL